MVIWRELISGAILCVLCCVAAIYSFAPSARVSGGVASVADDAPDDVPTPITSPLPQTPPEPSSEPSIEPKDATDEPKVVSDEPEHANNEPKDATDEVEEPQTLPENDFALPVPESDKVRWLRLPSEISEGPLPELAEPAPVLAEPLPPFGNPAGPAFDPSEPLIVVADEKTDGASLPPGGEPSHDAPSDEGDRSPPEFVATKPMMAGPDLLPSELPAEPSEPMKETLSESTDAKSGGSAVPAMELPPAGPQQPVEKRLVWHPPVSLLERLDNLAGHPQAKPWASSVVQHLELLGPSMEASSAEAGRLLAALDTAVAEGSALASRTSDLAVAAHLQRTAHALRRRIDVWRSILLLTQAADQELAEAHRDWDALALSLDRVEAFVGETTVGQAWREYLLLDALRHWTASRQAEEQALGRELAETTLQRLTQIPMDARQREFIDSSPVRDLKVQLHRVSAAPVEFGQMLAHLERYEQSRTPSDARRVARDYRRLADTAQSCADAV
ncbi:MAG: hypothetical protein ACOCWL_03470, partial [Thermoguttaceae bacterium]